MSGTSNEPSSYGRILRASAIIGSAEGLGMLLGLIRTKIAALLVGSVGLGMLGNYTSLQGLVGTFANMGVRSSAVREIAQSLQAGDELGVGRTVIALRRVCFAAGVLSTLAIFTGARVLSEITFGTDKFSFDIILLGIAVLLANMADAETAIIQGYQRIGQLARIKILSGFLATFMTALLYPWLGIHGIVPAIVCLAAANLVIAWSYSRRLPIAIANIRWFDTLDAARTLLRLGFVFMWNGLIFSLIGWLTRVMITNDLGLHAAGLFTAAYVLSQLLVNFITAAMSVDFYPRLSSHSSDPNIASRVINEQTEIGLLLALPGVLLIIAFAPSVLTILYSDDFLPASLLLQLLTLAALGRVVAWPLSYLMPALGRSRIYFIFETFINGLHLLLIYFGLKLNGLMGVALATLILQPIYLLLVALIGSSLVRFRWSVRTMKLFAALLPLVLVTLFVSVELPPSIARPLGGGMVLLTSVVCLRALVARVGHNHPLLGPLVRWPLFQMICGIKRSSS